ncbi:MAG TPA: CPBP family intramembrane glutamic endopeptidase [Burkholderiaceae bacterium]|nr:CPBP family intramembrane glutamic endopeptidase [Burkholderiaceae bacterium]
MRASLAAFAGIGGSAAVVFSTSILPLPLLLRVGHLFPPGDPRLVILSVQALCLVAVLVVLRVPIRSLLRGLPSRPGIRAVGWLTLGTLLFSLLVATTIVSTSGFEGQSRTADILARWAKEFPSTGLAGHFAFYAVLIPLFEELLYRGLILGCLLKRLPPWLALGVTTLLFAAGHPSWIFSALSGAALGLLYLRYQNLWLCVLAHGAHNLVSSAGAVLLVAYLHDMRFSPPIEMNLLLIQLSWTSASLACFAMFLRHVFAKVEGGHAVLLLGRRTSVPTGTTG